MFVPVVPAIREISAAGASANGPASSDRDCPSGRNAGAGGHESRHRRGSDSLASPAASGIRIEQNILVETHRLTSSLSCLLCHPNAEAAQLVIVDELDSGVFECGLNFDQS